MKPRRIPNPYRLRRTLRQAPAEAATPTDISMMRAALDLARTAADAGEVPVGAIVYETATGSILAQAANTREHNREPHGHAEFLAIRDACTKIGDWRLNHCTLVVTLEPCIMCAGLIVNARLGRLVYSADDPKAGAVRSLYRLTEDPRLNHRLTPIRGVLAHESSELLREFFRARRRSAQRG